MAHPFLERLQSGPMVCDGAMGTQLYARGVSYDRCFDELVVSQPDVVEAVHRDYLAAGAEIIETNTFGANRVRLAEHGLAECVTLFNTEAVAIARRAVAASGRSAFVAGAVGPLGKLVAPFGTLTRSEARAAFVEQIKALADAGVDLLILETFSHLGEMVETVKAAKLVAPALPLVAQMTFNEDGVTVHGDTPADVVAALEPLGVDVLGANCSHGSQPMLEVMEAMAAVASKPLAAQPNAGFPTVVDGRYMYLSSPDYMADYARQMIEVGVTLIGGCCGTTPAHIRALAEIARATPPARRVSRSAVAVRDVHPESDNGAAYHPTGLQRKLDEKFVVTVEVTPPRSFDVGRILPAIMDLRKSGLVDAINVDDNPRATAGLSALAMCSLIQSRVGMETVLHLACRTRNLIALHSELMGAHALGVRNVFVVMGDLPHVGNYPNASAVADVTASGLMSLIKRFNEGVDMNGKPLGSRTSFFVGCAFNLGAENLDKELKVLDKKIAAGADFILTQPIYEPETFFRVHRRLGEFPLPVIVGVMPLANHRNAEYLHNEVPGMVIPEDIRQRMREAGETEGRAEGIKIAQEFLDAVYEHVRGAYFIPQFRRYDTVVDVLQGLPWAGQRVPA
ncbi:MAG: bifunctional homocysteine S-methyltransferase/methylenetetrahydrofolate reductase [Anaerolineae bacterium]|nr:bifunctional homocysteine S-methyltransferase/methylenetetrahydrofolate reductase [Anaerolineae bacterium]